MRLNEMAGKLQEAAGELKPLQHPDEVQASIYKSGEEWLLWAQIGNFLPEISGRYLDPRIALKAVEDLYVLGIIVKGRQELEAAARAEAEVGV